MMVTDSGLIIKMSQPTNGRLICVTATDAYLTGEFTMRKGLFKPRPHLAATRDVGDVEASEDGDLEIDCFFGVDI